MVVPAKLKKKKTKQETCLSKWASISWIKSLIGWLFEDSLLGPSFSIAVCSMSIIICINSYINIRKSIVDLLVDCLGSGAGVSTRTFRDAQRDSSVAGELPIWQLWALSYSGNYALSECCYILATMRWVLSCCHWQLCHIMTETLSFTTFPRLPETSKLAASYRATIGWVLSYKDRLTLLFVVIHMLCQKL